MPAPFKIYADLECNLKGVKIDVGFTQKSIKITFLVVLLTKLFLLMIGLVRQLLFLGLKMLLMNLSKQFLRSMSTVQEL